MNRLHILRMLKKIIKKSRKKDAKSIIALLKKNIRKNKNKTRKIKHNQSKTRYQGRFIIIFVLLLTFPVIML